jgi:hypothetical protein
VVTYSSTGPRKRFREMIAAHGGGHDRGLPWLAPIRNSCELRVLCCRSCFGSRTCVRGITNSSRCAGFSIRVSPSHPYNAGSAGLGWGGAMQAGQDSCLMIQPQSPRRPRPSQLSLLFWGIVPCVYKIYTLVHFHCLL